MKYELTDEFKIFNDKKLYRIRALKALDNFVKVKKGDLGGFIESEKNLSQDGNCWIYDDSCVFDNAQIFENANIHNNVMVFGNARVFGEVKVSDHVRISGNAQVFENAKVSENVAIYNNAHVFGGVRISGRAQIYGNVLAYGRAFICGNVHIKENAKVFDNVCVKGKAHIYGFSHVYEDAQVCDNTKVGDNARVFGKSLIYDNAMVYDDAKICDFARICGNAKIGKRAIIDRRAFIITGYIEKYLSIEDKLSAQCFTKPMNDKVILYKRVDKIEEGKYKSLYDPNFIYEDGKEQKIDEKISDWDVNNIFCNKGIHLSYPTYWSSGDTLIACEVNINDVFEIQDGEVRCIRCKTLREVK